MLKVYGISNCDTVKKALKHLEKNQVDYEFIDFKKSPPNLKLLQACKKELGEWPVNKRGTTYRQFKNDFESASSSEQGKILIEHSSMIKRPLFFEDSKFLKMGYDSDFIDGL